MVASRLPRVLLLVTSLGLLSSCGFFSASTFPSALTQLAAQKDLSADIPADFARTFFLSAVTVGGIDLVFLASQMPYDGPHLFVMDQNLNTLQSFTLQDLISLSATFSNTRALLGKSGSVLILGLDCSMDGTGLTSFSPRSFTSIPAPGSFSFSDLNFNYADFIVSGNQLSYTIYDASWGFVSSSAVFPISSNSSLNFGIAGISSDPVSGFVAFILQEMTTAQDFYLLIPISSFSGTLASPLLASYRSFAAPEADNGLAAYSQNGFISFQRANNSQGGTFIRLATTGATLPYSLRYTDTTDIDIATRATGGWYYVYNRTTRILTKLNAWWGQ